MGDDNSGAAAVSCEPCLCCGRSSRQVRDGAGRQQVTEMLQRAASHGSDGEPVSGSKKDSSGGGSAQPSGGGSAQPSGGGSAQPSDGGAPAGAQQSFIAAVARAALQQQVAPPPKLTWSGLCARRQAVLRACPGSLSLRSAPGRPVFFSLLARCAPGGGLSGLSAMSARSAAQSGCTVVLARVLRSWTRAPSPAAAGQAQEAHESMLAWRVSEAVRDLDGAAASIAAGQAEVGLRALLRLLGGRRQGSSLPGALCFVGGCLYPSQAREVQGWGSKPRCRVAGRMGAHTQLRVAAVQARRRAAGARRACEGARRGTGRTRYGTWGAPRPPRAARSAPARAPSGPPAAPAARAQARRRARGAAAWTRPPRAWRSSGRRTRCSGACTRTTRSWPWTSSGWWRRRCVPAAPHKKNAGRGTCLFGVPQHEPCVCMQWKAPRYRRGTVVRSGTRAEQWARRRFQCTSLE